MTPMKFLQLELGFDQLSFSQFGLRDWSEDRHICHIPIGAAILGGAGISGASSLAGGKKGASAATSAASKQYQAALQALGQQQLVREQNIAELQPFADYGRAAIPAFQSALNQLTAPIDTSLPQFTFQPTMADLEKTPGYQFTLSQALKAGQNALTATGLGRSMSAVNTATNVAAGTAASTWPTVFNAEQQMYQTNVNSLLAGRTMDLQQRQQIANLLDIPINTGLSASGALAGANLQSGQQIASTITGAGAAQASGIVGAANAQIAGLQGVSSAASSIPQSLILANAFGSGGGFNSLFGTPTADAGLAYMQNPSLNVGGTP